MTRIEFDTLITAAVNEFKVALASTNTDALVDVFESGDLPVTVSLKIDGARVTDLRLFPSHDAPGWRLTIEEDHLDVHDAWMKLADVALQLEAEMTGLLLEADDKAGTILIKEPSRLGAALPTQLKVFDMSAEAQAFEVFQDENGFSLRGRVGHDASAGHSARPSADWAQLQSQLCSVKPLEELEVLDDDVFLNAVADNKRKIDLNFKLLSQALMQADCLER